MAERCGDAMFKVGDKVKVRKKVREANDLPKYGVIVAFDDDDYEDLPWLVEFEDWDGGHDGDCDRSGDEKNKWWFRGKEIKLGEKKKV